MDLELNWRVFLEAAQSVGLVFQETPVCSRLETITKATPVHVSAAIVVVMA